MKTASILCPGVFVFGLLSGNAYAPPCDCTVDPDAVKITPQTVIVTEQFIATPNQYCIPPHYVWSDDCTRGEVDQNGLFTVPTPAHAFSAERCHVCATDAASNERPVCCSELRISSLSEDCELVIYISPPQGGTTVPSPPRYFIPGCFYPDFIIEAFPNPGYTFSHFEFSTWEGVAQISESPLAVTINGNASITALFSAITTTSSSVTTTTPPCSMDADCDDSLFCNGAETCHEPTGSCLSGASPCTEGEECNELLDRCFVPSASCRMSLEPEASETTSGQKISFAVSQAGDCAPPDYEWSVESTIGSVCDASGNYKAGINFDRARPKTDIVRVVDTGNGDISAEATVTVFSQCASVHIYGENARELYVLRKFRDEVLNKTPEGRQLIRLYYQISPALVRTIENNEALREDIKDMLDALLPWPQDVIE